MPDVVTLVGAVLIKGGNPWFMALGWVLIVVGSVWGGEEAKRQQKEKEDAAKRAYNDSLKDRTATVISSESPHRYIYGRARVGSSIVAVLTSGARDEYKHLVCVHAAHECDSIEEIYINGKALGTLDGNGHVTSGDYFINTIGQFGLTFSGTGVTLPHTPIAGSLRLIYTASGGTEYQDYDAVETNYTLVGNVISGAPSRVYRPQYSYAIGTPYVRVKKHLGNISDDADATLISEVPTKWDLTKKLTGLCYTVVTLNLNFTDFQGGVPTVEALIRGKKLHDVRSGSYPNDTPVWSQNNALMVADYLTSEMNNVPWTDLPLADYIAAANVCDESTIYGAKYLANGTVDADQSQPQVLEKMGQSMAGTICATTWGIKAGKYVAPIMSLSQDDIVGDISYTAGTPEADLYNGVKGQYISAANIYVPTDFEPYQNSTYVAADGSELWTDVSFMFTDTKQMVHNICRVFTEDQRNGFTIVGSFSYKTWSLQVGDRVSFTSSFIGQTNKIYRVIKKDYSIESAVGLTLKEDAAEIWDLADAVTEDATPNTDFPSPFIVNQPGNIQVTEELYQTTGSSGIKIKAIVTWTAPADANVLDYEITYKSYFDAYYNIKLYSTTEYLEIYDIAEGIYDIKIRARNNLNIYSEYTDVKTFTIYGLSLRPGNVTGFTIVPFNGSALARWDRTTDLDVKIGGDIEIRFCPLISGASWEQSIIIPDGNYNGDATNAIVSLATGTYYAKFKDSTNNYSLVEASFVATEALVTGWSTVATSTQHTGFTGAKTDISHLTDRIILAGRQLIDDWGLIDDQGLIDSIGGVSTIGTYEFDSVMDLTTIASRRFHSHIKSLAYLSNDSIDSRLDLIDTWDDVDGGVINGANAITYISVSNDNIIYTDWLPFMVADLNCRYAKFKTILTTSNSTHNIEITELGVSAKIPV